MQIPPLPDDPVFPPDGDATEDTADMLLLSVEQITAVMHLADGDERLLRQLLAAMAQQPARRRRRRRSKAKAE